MFPLLVSAGRTAALSSRRALVVALALLLALPLVGSSTGTSRPAAAQDEPPASTLMAMDRFSGTVNPAGTSFVTHSFVVGAAGTRRLTLDWPSATTDLNLGLRDPAGTYVKWAGSPTARPETITWDMTATGTWTLAVKAKAGPATSYSAVVEDVAPTPACPGDFCGAVSTTGTSFVAHKFSVPASGLVRVVLDWDTAGANLDLGLRRPDDVVVASTRSTTARPEVLEFAATTPGTWAVTVQAKSGSASYTATVSIGAGQPARLGDLVWDDTDGDGVRDTGEPGLGGVPVRVLTSDETVAATTTTAPDGSWSVSLSAGTYRVAVELPAGTSHSPRGRGGDAERDSDVDPGSGRTALVPVVSGEQALRLDAGALRTGRTATRGALTTSTTSVDVPVQVTAGGLLEVVVDWEDAAADLAVSVLDPTGAVVAADPGGRPAAVATVAARTGRYVARVRATGGTSRFVASTRAGATVPASAVPSYTRTIGGPGRAMTYPSGLDVDDAGRVYLADTGNDVVQAYDGATRVWTSGRRGKLAGQFSEPRDVAVMGGRVYVADTGNNRIQVLDAADGRQLAVWPTRYGAIMGIGTGVGADGRPVVLGSEATTTTSTVRVHDPQTGAVLRTMGSYGTGDGQLNEPRDAATTPDGTVYVADYRNHRVAVFSATGRWLRSFGALGAEHGSFNAPYGIDIDAAGALYVTDSNNARVEKYTTAGAYLASFGSRGTGQGQFFQLRRAVVGAGAAPLVYTADLWGNRYAAIRQDGTVAFQLAEQPAPAGGFNKPYGLALRDGDVYVSDTTNHRVEHFRADGTYLSSVGARGFGETTNGFNWPRDVTFSPTTGTLWVMDTKNHRLVEYGLDEMPTGRKLGSLGTTDGKFNWPAAVVPVGNDLIVADMFNNRVQRISPGATGNKVLWSVDGMKAPKDVVVVGDVVHVADSGNRRVATLRAGDGALLASLTNPALHDPAGITVLPSGVLWVTDGSWNRLVELGPDGALRRTLGKSGATNGSFDGPTKLESRSTPGGQELFVVDTFNDRVEVFTQ